MPFAVLLLVRCSEPVISVDCKTNFLMKEYIYCWYTVECYDLLFRNHTNLEIESI